MKGRVRKAGNARGRLISATARNRKGYYLSVWRRWLTGRAGRVLAALVVAAAAAWGLGRDMPLFMALPRNPIAIDFVDAHFRHERRAISSSDNRLRDVSTFILIIDVRNDTNHQITAQSADFYDKSGYFLFSCAIAGKEPVIAQRSAAKQRCVAHGGLAQAKVEALLKRICEIDLNVAGDPTGRKQHPVPWPRAQACHGSAL